MVRSRGRLLQSQSSPQMQTTMTKKTQNTDEKPVPDDYRTYLTDMQYLRLESMRHRGWEVKLVKRPLFQMPICVVAHPIRNQLAVIEVEGTVHLIDNDGTYRNEIYTPGKDD